MAQTTIHALNRRWLTYLKADYPNYEKWDSRKKEAWKDRFSVWSYYVPEVIRALHKYGIEFTFKAPHHYIAWPDDADFEEIFERMCDDFGDKDLEVMDYATYWLNALQVYTKGY